MSTEWNSLPLDSLGVLRARGADVVSFLQGQLSNDIALLGPGRSLLAGYHNPQGRVIALLRLLQLAPDDLLAILPRELIAAVVQRLGKFVLRAKVKLADDSAAWTVTGLMGCAPPRPGVRSRYLPSHPDPWRTAGLPDCQMSIEPKWERSGLS